MTKRKMIFAVPTQGISIQNTQEASRKKRNTRNQQKLGKEYKHAFYENGNLKNSKYLKRCSNSVVTQEMHFKNNLMPYENGKTQKPDNIRYWCGFADM